MNNLGDRTCQEIHIAGLISSVKEAQDRGENPERDRQRLVEDLTAYRIRYGSLPPLICDDLPRLGVYLS